MSIMPGLLNEGKLLPKSEKIQQQLNPSNFDNEILTKYPKSSPKSGKVWNLKTFFKGKAVEKVEGSAVGRSYVYNLSRVVQSCPFLGPTNSRQKDKIWLWFLIFDYIESPFSNITILILLTNKPFAYNNSLIIIMSWNLFKSDF